MDYRLYFMDEAGRISEAADLKAENDVAAVEAAKKLEDGRPMELWHQARVVAKLTPASAA